MTDDSPNQPGKSKALLITLIAVGGALLIAIIVLVVVLLTGGGGASDDDSDAAPTPSTSDASQTPSPTPSESDEVSPTPTPAPSATEEEEAAAPPPSNDPKINSFTSSTTTFVCPEADDFDSPTEITLHWTTTNVDKVYLGVNTNDASKDPYLTDQPGNGEATMNISCPGNQTNKYTLTVIGDGQKVSKTIKVVVK